MERVKGIEPSTFSLGSSDALAPVPITRSHSSLRYYPGRPCVDPEVEKLVVRYAEATSGLTVQLQRNTHGVFDIPQRNGGFDAVQVSAEFFDHTGFTRDRYAYSQPEKRWTSIPALSA